MGKVLYLPSFYLATIFMVTFRDKKFSMFFVETIFMLSFANFFWEKGCRFLGINQLLARDGT